MAVLQNDGICAAASPLPDYIRYNLFMSAHHYDPHRHHRRSIRLPGWDYRTQAVYFVTICTANRQTLFDDPRMAEVASVMWQHIPQRPHAVGVILDEWVLMPNHLHGLLFLPDQTPPEERDTSDPAVLPGLPFDMHYATQPDSIPEKGGRRRLPAGSLGAIVGGYKSSVSRRINAMRGTPGHPI